MKEPFPFYSIGDFVNRPQDAIGCEVTLFGEMDEPDVDDVHKHSFYEIIWIEEGDSSHFVDYQSYFMSSGSLFFISPGQVHSFESWKAVKGGSLMFTSEFFLLANPDKHVLFELSFLDNLYTNPSLTLDREPFLQIVSTLNAIIKEKRRPDTSETIVRSLLAVLLAQIQREVDCLREPVSKRNLFLFKTLVRLIEVQYRKGWTAGMYASEMHLTQHHLNNVCKDLIGKTASQVIRDRSILEAKRLLTFTDASVSEIAVTLSYFDVSYFSKIFRQETGISPKKFRTSSENYQKR